MKATISFGLAREEALGQERTTNVPTGSFCEERPSRRSRTGAGPLLLIVAGLIGFGAQSAQATTLGTGRVEKVEPLDGGCVKQTINNPSSVESWDVQQGKTYLVTLSEVTECVGAEIQVIVKSSSTGNQCLVANNVAEGTYQFRVTMPENACNTLPILYCTTDCGESTGYFARRSDGGDKQSHLRAAIFTGDCQKVANDTDCTGGPTGAACLRGLCLSEITQAEAEALGATDWEEGGTCATKDCGTGPLGCLIFGPEGTDLGCNPDPANIPDCSFIGTSGCVVDGTFNCELFDENNGCSYSRRVVASALGCDGSSCEYDQTFTWTVDITPPEVRCPENITVTADPETCGAVVHFCATATDNCGAGVVNISIYSGTEQGNGSFDELTLGGGAPYTDFVGALTAPNVSFGVESLQQDTVAGGWHPFGLGSFGADLTGTLVVAVAGTYTFTLDSDDGALLYIDGALVIDNGNAHPPASNSGDATLTEGQHCFEIQFFECCGGPSGLNLILPDGVTYGVAAVCDPPSGSVFPVGTTTVTCLAADACGNVGKCSFNVTVNGLICAYKFYDANANGKWDDGEPPVAGWKFSLSDGQVGFTGADGKVCFSAPVGEYTVTEVPPDTAWAPTAASSCAVQITPENCVATCRFGNVCLGAGGGHTLGFWSNRNGEKVLNDDGGPGAELALLAGLCLRDAVGNDFDPASYSAFRTWLLNADATNMAYMLSVQLAAMVLNVEAGFVDGSSLVYAPGCGEFVMVNDLITAANQALCGDGYTPAGDPNRALQECLKDALDKANNNLTFVQAVLCPFSTPY